MLERSLVSTVTGPMARLLVPVADVRTELGEASSADAKITRLLYAAAAAFAGPQGLGRSFLRQSYLERTNGDGGTLLLLSRWPVESVTSVTEGIDDPTTISAADYEIALEGRNALLRTDGWSTPLDCGRARVLTGGDLYSYAVTYVAGWIPPGDGPGLVEAWSANKVKALGSFVKPAATANGQVTLVYEATTGGTTGASEPTWPSTVGSTVNDGATAVWTARQASELPDDIKEAAILTAISWYRGSLSLPQGIALERLGPQEIQYDFVGARDGLAAIPPAARHILWSHR